ncbi:MAG: Xaa-Pro peptidase family protein [Erysipelotrichaceae bacterium]|jgi:Xaa-Pro aminopeptidase|nr:Xaa-Pro peptidase family protein [Erysipelotrichaceae bacterium]
MAFYKEKIALAKRVMKEKGIDMWIVAGSESATASEPILPVISDGEFIGATALVFCSDGTNYTVCTPIDANGYIHAGIFDEVIGFKVNFETALGELIKRKNPANIALDYSENDPGSDGLTYGFYTVILDALKIAGFSGEVISAYPITSTVRGVKSDWELKRIRHSAKVAEEIFDAAKDFIRPGKTALDVFNFFQSEVDKRKAGYGWSKSCDPGVFSGKDSPGGHMPPPPIAIEAGNMVNIDFGVKINEYSCDLQRMYYILKDGETDAPAEAKRAFNVVRDSILKAAAFLKPGVTGLETDTVCRSYILENGYDDFNHATGHEMGREAHDGGPLLGPRKPRYDRPDLIEVPVLEGMVFTLEPGVMTPYGRCGLEEDVVVTPNGAEFLTPPQKELYIIDPKAGK